MKIKVEPRHKALRIYVNGVLHLHLPHSEDLAMQSWRDPKKSKWVIEYSTSAGSILTEYDSETKWATILKQLELLL